MAIVSYTSPNICVARGGMSRRSTSVAMGIGLSGNDLGPRSLMLRGAVCARRKGGMTSSSRTVRLAPRKARDCYAAFGLGGPRL